MTFVLLASKPNVALASNHEHNSLYVVNYISGPWSQSGDSTSEGYTAGNIILVNPTSNSLSNLKLTIQVDSSEIISPSLRLWDLNYTLNPPNSFFQSEHLFEDIQNFSTKITSINIEPNQKETISISIPSSSSFQFSSHNLKIYVSQNNFGDIINGQLLIIPQTEAYLQIVNFSAIESDEDTYHQYYNSTLKSNMVTVAYNPNFYQRYHNISKFDYYSDNFGIMHHMGALDYSYFNVTVFNNTTFPVNSVMLSGQISSQGSYANYWRALMGYAMQPSEAYLFPVASTEHPSSASVTGYITNNSAPASPTPAPSVPEFPIIIVIAIILTILTLAISVFKRKTH